MDDKHEGNSLSYLGLDQSLGSLYLGLTERPSVLGADVRPYGQVGGLVQSLEGERKGGHVRKEVHSTTFLLNHYSYIYIHVFGRGPPSGPPM